MVSQNEDDGIEGLTGTGLFDEIPLRKMSIIEQQKVIEEVKRGSLISDAIQEYVPDLPRFGG